MVLKRNGFKNRYTIPMIIKNEYQKYMDIHSPMAQDEYKLSQQDYKLSQQV